MIEEAFPACLPFLLDFLPEPSKTLSPSTSPRFSTRRPPRGWSFFLEAFSAFFPRPPQGVSCLSASEISIFVSSPANLMFPSGADRPFETTIRKGQKAPTVPPSAFRISRLVLTLRTPYPFLCGSRVLPSSRDGVFWRLFSPTEVAAWRTVLFRTRPCGPRSPC